MPTFQSRISQELVDLIVDKADEYDDTQFLRTLSTLASCFLPRSQARLFWNLRVGSPKKVDRLLEMVSVCPALALLPRTLEIEDCRPLQWNEHGLIDAFDDSWVIPLCGTSLLALIQSLPKVRAIFYCGDGCENTATALDDSHGPSAFQRIFCMPNITSIRLRNTFTESCHDFFSLFRGGSVAHLHVEHGFVHSQSDASCTHKTKGLPALSPSRRHSLSTLSIEASACLMDYLISEASLVETGELTRLSLSLQYVQQPSPAREKANNLLGPRLLELEITETFYSRDDVFAQYQLRRCHSLRRLRITIELPHSRDHSYIDVWDFLSRTVGSLPSAAPLELLEVVVTVHWFDIRSHTWQNPLPDPFANDAELRDLINWHKLDKILSTTVPRFTEVNVRLAVSSLPDGQWLTDILNQASPEGEKRFPLHRASGKRPVNLMVDIEKEEVIY